jgi:hypothetical protein
MEVLWGPLGIILGAEILGLLLILAGFLGAMRVSFQQGKISQFLQHWYMPRVVQSVTDPRQKVLALEALERFSVTSLLSIVSGQLAEDFDLATSIGIP